MFELTRRAFNKFVFGTVAGGVIVGRRKALAAEQLRRDLSRVIKYRRIFRRWGAMWVPVQFEEIRRGDDVLALDLDDGVLSMMERWRVDGDPERIKGEPYNAGVKVGVSANLLTWPMEVKGAEADKDACPVSFYGATSGMGRRLFVQSFHVTKCDCVGVPVEDGAMDAIDKRWTWQELPGNARFAGDVAPFDLIVFHVVGESILAVFRVHAGAYISQEPALLEGRRLLPACGYAFWNPEERAYVAPGQVDGWPVPEHWLTTNDARRTFNEWQIRELMPGPGKDGI